MSRQGTYHHAKTNGDYAVLCVGTDSTNATNGRRMTIYISVKDDASRQAATLAMAAINDLLALSPGGVRVREEAEFDSPGRFVAQEG